MEPIQQKLEEKNIIDDGDIVMRTETCGKVTEPMVTEHNKYRLNSSICQVESAGISDEGEVRIGRSGTPSPIKYASASKQSPDLHYIPSHSRVIFLL